MADIINRWNVNGIYYQIHDYGRGLPGGVATLDAEGRIPYQQLPLSTVTYKGAWEANVNVPDLTALTDVIKGDMYVVISSGRQNLNMFKYTAIANPAGYNPQAQGWYEYDGTDYVATTDTVAQIGKVYYSRSPMGSVMFLVGDRVIWDGQQWERVPSGGVTSVNGKSGDVVLTGNDVALSPDTATSVTETIKAMDYNSGTISGDFIANIQQTDGKITSVTKGSIPAGASVTDAAVAGQYVSAVSQANGKISVSRASLPRIISSFSHLQVESTRTFTIPNIKFHDEVLDIGLYVVNTFSSDYFVDAFNCFVLARYEADALILSVSPGAFVRTRDTGSSTSTGTIKKYKWTE